jgi:hypothetical protein
MAGVRRTFVMADVQRDLSTDRNLQGSGCRSTSERGF